jgi:hypothetical protein
MICLPIPLELKDICWEYVQNNNIGHRFDFNGSTEQQYLGLLGENMVRKYYGIPYSFSEGFDGGHDIILNGYKIDVKTMGRTVDPQPHYANNFVAYQKELDCDILYFTSINKKTSTIFFCGWSWKRDFLNEALYFEQDAIRHRDDGTTFKTLAPLYEISNKNLNAIK